MRSSPPGRRTRVVAVLALAGALAWGRTHATPDVEDALSSVFPSATVTEPDGAVLAVYGPEHRLLGWAGTGSGSGYGGPMLLLVGLDTTGSVEGMAVVEHRETPVFWSLVKAPQVIRELTGRAYADVSADLAEVASVSGATLSATALVESIREAVFGVANAAFGETLLPPSRPFEFGFYEVVVLALLVLGLLAGKTPGRLRSKVRWGAQITGLCVIGFWKDSPITLSKLAAILSGFLPDPRSNAVVYILIGGFALTALGRRRNIYCLYACPFGAAQRCVGALGGARLALPATWVRGLGQIRGTVVFAALFLAFLGLQPALAGYEPFAVLFSLRGSTLQWMLLLLVLSLSLVLRTPWCTVLCPMQTVELTLSDVGSAFRRVEEKTSDA